MSKEHTLLLPAHLALSDQIWVLVQLVPGLTLSVIQAVVHPLATCVYQATTALLSQLLCLNFVLVVLSAKKELRITPNAKEVTIAHLAQLTQFHALQASTALVLLTLTLSVPSVHSAQQDQPSQ